MTNEQSLHLCKVSRTLVYAGEYFMVECAVRENGSSPAQDMLTQLQLGMVDVPDFPPPDDAQTKFYTDLLTFIQEVADGYEPRNGSLNYLQDGIWEFKRETIRITFYDADGAGNSHGHQNRIFLAHYFYPILRLGHSFVKTTEKTSPHDLQETFNVRKEDLNHDRTN